LRHPSALAANSFITAARCRPWRSFFTMPSKPIRLFCQNLNTALRSSDTIAGHSQHHEGQLSIATGVFRTTPEIFHAASADLVLVNAPPEQVFPFCWAASTPPAKPRAIHGSHRLALRGGKQPNP